eukprot:JP446939.1.p1 GENE.JP446939.1~~JP446939.1.p1  ORF type:complete len:203 (+),score=82.01 JP446939.1:41-649(+)
MTEPFFPGLTARFAAIQLEDGEIPVEVFLSACAEILPIFDRLGMVFKTVKSDIHGNLDKIGKAFKTTHASCPTLTKMVQKDIADKNTKKDGLPTVSLLWLKRALEFITLLLGKLSSTDHEVKQCGQEAYDATLVKFHGFIVRKTFGAGMSAVPTKKDFCAKFGSDEAQTISEMAEYVKVFSPFLENIQQLYISNQLDDASTV